MVVGSKNEKNENKYNIPLQLIVDNICKYIVISLMRLKIDCAICCNVLY